MYIVICTDSFSAIMALQLVSQHFLIYDILKLIIDYPKKNHIVWIRGYQGILENELVDAIAKMQTLWKPY